VACVDVGVPWVHMVSLRSTISVTKFGVIADDTFAEVSHVS
jgi:hypothetical protein